MIIRSEQIAVFNAIAKTNFVRKLCMHLRTNYAETVVRLPGENSVLGELSDDTLETLVRSGVRRAREYGISFESTISAFVALMFEIAPNFHTHEIAQPVLKDENVEANSRVDILLERLSEEDLSKIKETYDVNAWKQNEEGIEG